MGFLGSIFAAKNEFEAKALPGSGQFTQQDFASALEQARDPRSREQQQRFTDSLQGQAEGTAPSVAQAQLGQAVGAQNQQAATAIGSQRGINPALAARLIAQQQAQNTQGMAGQAATAGIQERQSAQALLGNALGQQRGQSLQEQGMLQQGVANQNQQLVGQNQGVQSINAGVAQQNQKAANDFLPGLLGGVGAAAGVLGMTDGGTVPGSAKVAGDSYENDTVPIMASPGEVVLPRSVASDPDKAKEFVEGLRANSKSGAGAKDRAEAPSYAEVVESNRKLEKRLAELGHMALGGEVPPEKEGAKKGDTSTGASTGGIGSGLGGAGTGGAATGGASTGGAGTVTLTVNSSGADSSTSKGGGKASSSKGAGKTAPTIINISNVGGTTDAGNVASGDGPGAKGTGGTGKEPSKPEDIEHMAKGGVVSPETAASFMKGFSSFVPSPSPTPTPKPKKKKPNE